MNSGTDALTLGLHILGVRKGDEVITLPNSFIASNAAIVHSSTKLIIVDIKEDQNININSILPGGVKNLKNKKTFH